MEITTVEVDSKVVVFHGQRSLSVFSEYCVTRCVCQTYLKALTQLRHLQRHKLFSFYAPQLYRQVLLRRVLAMGILSVRLSVRVSRPGGIPSPGPGLHRMIA